MCITVPPEVRDPGLPLHKNKVSSGKRSLEAFFANAYYHGY